MRNQQSLLRACTPGAKRCITPVYTPLGAKMDLWFQQLNTNLMHFIQQSVEMFSIRSGCFFLDWMTTFLHLTQGNLLTFCSWIIFYPLQQPICHAALILLISETLFDVILVIQGVACFNFELTLEKVKKKTLLLIRCVRIIVLRYLLFAYIRMFDIHLSHATVLFNMLIFIPFHSVYANTSYKLRWCHW